MHNPREIDHRYAPSNSWTCIGRPADKLKTIVSESGSLMYDFAAAEPAEGTYWFNQVFSFALKIPERPGRITQETESARAPIVRTTVEYSKVTLELLAIGHAHDGVDVAGMPGRTDIVLWTVTNKTDEGPRDVALRVDAEILGRVLALPDPGPTNNLAFGGLSGNRVYSLNATYRRLPHTDLNLKYKTTQPELQNEPDERLAFLSVPHALRPDPNPVFGPSPSMRTEILTVAPGTPLQGAFIFPLNHELTAEPDLQWAVDALDEERRFWASYPITELQWQLPDPGVMDMVTSCARNILQASEPWDGLIEFQVGPTVYRGLWVVDGHFILEAARYLGHQSAGRQGIEALLRRVQPNGAIVQLVWHLKETGISIATLIRQCELDDDWDRVASLWQTIMNAVGYIRTLREESRKGGPDTPEYGLMPPTFGDGGLSGLRGEYTTTMWTLVGLKWAARAARKLGYEEDGRSVQAEFDDLMRVFHEKAERDMRTLPDGTPYLPQAMPDGGGEHTYDPHHEGDVSPYYRINPATAIWALGHAIYPGEVFGPDDPIVENYCSLLEQIDDEEGIPAGASWLPHNGLCAYFSSFYAHVWLYAGRPDKAIDYLYAFANHSTPTRVWREEQSLRSSHYEQIVGEMPHNWGSAEFIRLTRHLLVFERLGNLELLPGLPPEWITEGGQIRLEKTPTRYGAVDLRITFSRNGAEITLGLEQGRSEKPKQVLLHVPEVYSQVVIDGTHADVPAARLVELLPQSVQKVRLQQ